MSDIQEDGFLSRWSRRKRAIAAGEEITELSPKEEAAQIEVAERDPEALAAIEAEHLANREAAEAIDLESLTYESDFSAFFKDGVPTLLRQRALKILWRSNPVLANIDGLCDYDENFADPALILDKFESAYKIGKGYLFDEDDSEDIPDDIVSDTTDHIAQNQESDAENDEEANDNTIEAEEASAEEEYVAKSDDQEELQEPDQDEALSSHANIAPQEEMAVVERPYVSLRRRMQFET